MVVKINQQEIEARARRATVRGMKKAGEQVAAIARYLIQNPPKTGRIYNGHQASAPGEAPANWTGALAASLSVEVSSESLAGVDFVDVTVRSISPYAYKLEYGTAKIAPRPFLRPAAEAVRADAGTIVGLEFTQGF